MSLLHFSRKQNLIDNILYKRNLRYKVLWKSDKRFRLLLCRTMMWLQHKTFFSALRKERLDSSNLRRRSICIQDSEGWKKRTLQFDMQVCRDVTCWVQSIAL